MTMNDELTLPQIEHLYLALEKLHLGLEGIDCFGHSGRSSFGDPGQILLRESYNDYHLQPQVRINPD